MKKLKFWLLSILAFLLFGCRPKPDIKYRMPDGNIEQGVQMVSKEAWDSNMKAMAKSIDDSASYLIDDSTGRRVTDSGDIIYIDTVHWHSEVSPIVRKRTKPKLHYYQKP